MTHQGGIANTHNGTTPEGLLNIFGFPTSNLSRTRDSNRRKELSDIRRCRLKSGQPACFVQKASHCRRWSKMDGDRKPFSSSFGFLPIKGCRSTPSNKGCWPWKLISSLCHWPPMTIRELLSHIQVLANCSRNANQPSRATRELWLVRTLLLTSLTLKILRQHKLFDSASLWSQSDACQPITPANPKIIIAGVTIATKGIMTRMTENYQLT